MHVNSILNGLARARATRAAVACTNNDICSGDLLIDKITKKKQQQRRFKDNEVNTYCRNYKQQWHLIFENR